MKVYSSPNVAMVGHLKNVLEIHGIVCEVRGEYRDGELPPESGPELWVRDESQLEQAKQIIAESLESNENESWAWKCPSCGEEVEGQFTECWSCGTSRPGGTET